MRALAIVGVILTLYVPVQSFSTEAVKFHDSQLVTEDIRKVQRPGYPLEARRQRLAGAGIFSLNINSKTGRVTSVDTKKSTGHEILDAECRRAFITWRFKPHTVTKVWVPATFQMIARP